MDLLQTAQKLYSKSEATEVAKRPKDFVHFLERDLDFRHNYHLKEPQVALMYLLDGYQPGDVPEPYRAHALHFAGGVERWAKARDIYFTKGARIAGTLGVALKVFHIACWLPIEETPIAPGEEAYIPICAPLLKTAKQIRNYVWGAAKLLCGENRKHAGQVIHGQGIYEGFQFKRVGYAVEVTQPNGFVIPIDCFAARAGGASVRGISMPAAVMDESSFFKSEENGAINDAEIHRAMVIRVIGHPMCRMFVLSTAWAEEGILYEAQQEEFGQPLGKRRCLMARTEEARPCDPGNPVDVAFQNEIDNERRNDARNAAREFDCVPFKSGGFQFYDTAAIEQCVQEYDLPVSLTEVRSYLRFGLIMAAGGDFATIRNSAVLALGGTWMHDQRKVYKIFELLELKPDGEPLDPDHICATWVDALKRFSCEAIVTDQVYRALVRKHMHGAELGIIDAPVHPADSHTILRDIMVSGCLTLPKNTSLIKQLKDTRGKPMPGGRLQIQLPQWHTGEHGDLVAGLANLVWRLFHQTPVPLRIPVAQPNDWADQLFERAQQAKDLEPWG